MTTLHITQVMELLRQHVPDLVPETPTSENPFRIRFSTPALDESEVQEELGHSADGWWDVMVSRDRNGSLYEIAVF